MTSGAEYLRAADIARLLGISLRTVRRWIADGTLASTKIGGARLVATADLDRILSPSTDLAEFPDSDGGAGAGNSTT
jgi:excisionase family DNA binding protein